MIPIDFQVTCLKVKVKPFFWAQCVVRSISLDPFTWTIPNLVQGMPLMSRWSLLIFRAHVQRSRSNYFSEPSVLSTIYILIPCLLALDRFCFHREDKPEFCTMGGIYVSETLLVFYLFILVVTQFMYSLLLFFLRPDEGTGRPENWTLYFLCGWSF